VIVQGFDPAEHELPADCFLDRDEDAPELFAVWLRGDDGDVLGSGSTSEEAIADAQATVRAWDAVAETERNPAVSS
jgi:hypothetical protein